jgi:hypothetical protein
MDNGSIIAISLLGLLTWAIIMHYVVKGAVKSALYKQEFHLRALYRIEITKMIEQGRSKEELSNLQHSDDVVFWDKLEVKKETTS